MLFRRVLITGANGLVGQELVRLLSTRDDLDVLATGRDDAPRFTGGSCGYTRLDVTRTDEIRRVFEDFAPDVLVNAAAMTRVDECEEKREDCWNVNVSAVESLAGACLVHGTRLIQLSTDFIFDGENGPYRENDRPNPINFYGKSKQAAENAVRGAGLDRWAIARTVLVYGTGEHLSRSNVALWILGKLSVGEPINVVTDQVRTPTYAPDLAEGIDRIVRYGKTGVYHLSGRELVSINEFAHTIAAVFDLDSALISTSDSSQIGHVARRPLRTGFIILKAETELGFRPRLIEDALRHMAARMHISIAAR